MTKRIPLPTGPQERKREQYRRRMLSVGASIRRRAAALKANRANLDLVGGVMPRAIAKRAPLPKEPSAKRVEQQLRNARRMTAKRAARQRAKLTIL